MGIIFDTELSRILIEPKDSITYSNKLNEILFALLLYEKAYIPSKFLETNNKYLKELINEGFISIIPDEFYFKEEEKVIKTVEDFQLNFLQYTKLSDEQFTCSYDEGIITAYGEYGQKVEYSRESRDKDRLAYESLQNTYFFEGSENSQLKLNKEIIWEYYKLRRFKQGKKYSPSQLASFGIHFVEHLSFTEGFSIDDIITLADSNQKDIKHEIKKSIDEFIKQETYALSLLELRRHLEMYYMRTKSLRNNELLKEFQKKILNDEFNLYDLNIERLYFLKNYIQFKELISFSYEKKLLIKGQIGVIPSSNLKKTIINKDHTYSVYKLILEEIEYLPRLYSIEDVMRLRRDKRISDFREVINEWSNAINIGDAKQELKLRKDIRKANLEFKRIKKYQKIGGWITYISLPLIIVDMLSGIPTGSILTGIGGAIQFEASRLNKKNQWLLFGNRL